MPNTNTKYKNFKKFFNNIRLCNKYTLKKKKKYIKSHQNFINKKKMGGFSIWYSYLVFGLSNEYITGWEIQIMFFEEQYKAQGKINIAALEYTFI